MLYHNYSNNCKFSMLLPAVVFIFSSLGLENTEGLNAANLIGTKCSLSGSRNYVGQCKSIQDCPSAISNLRAGLFPTLCLRSGKIAIVCCITQKRISDLMCENYSKASSDGVKAGPLLPSGGHFESNENKEEGIVVKKEGSEVAFVVGGKNAALNQFPQMAALGYGNGRNNVSWLCGGTLISNQFILTAAHCLQATRKGKLTKVMLGDVNLVYNSDSPKSRQEIEIERIYIYPNYTTSLKYNDIGLIKLSRKVVLSHSIKPACLPQSKSRLELISEVSAVGFGLTEFAGELSELLQFVRLTRFSQQECIKEYKDEPSRVLQFPQGIIPSQFCAGERKESKDTCEGDSGAGLLVKQRIADKPILFVVGITSFGSKYCGYGQLGVYTNVQSYLDWIEDIVWT